MRVARSGERAAAAWIAAAALVLATAAAAHAQDVDRDTRRLVTVSLKGPAEERPLYVCVAQSPPASRSDPADRSEHRWLLLADDDRDGAALEALPDGARRFPVDPTQLVCAAEDEEAREALQQAAAKPTPPAPDGEAPARWEGSWCSAEKARGEVTIALQDNLPSKFRAVVEALKELGQRQTDAAACAARLAACDASVRLGFETDSRRGGEATRPVYFTCARNSQDLRGTKRVLVLQYKSKAGALIETVGLDGSTVTLSLSKGEKDGSTVLVAGGHFRDDSDAATTAGQVPLPIRALCVERDVRLPAVGDASGTALTVTLDRSAAGGPASCESELKNPLRVWLPRQGAAVEKSLSAELRRADGALVARVSGGWHEATPPEKLELALETVTFEWQPPCEYTAALDCPRATLVEPGIECSGETVFETPLRCRYECPGNRNPTARFGLPATVAMGAPDQGRWSVRLSSAGQVVGGYVADKRPFFVHFPFLEPPLLEADASRNDAEADAEARTPAGPAAARERLQWHGDAIDALRLRTSSGQVVLFPIEGSSQRVLLPDVICGDFLRYRYQGDREHEEGTIRIRHADIMVPDPDATARTLWLGVLVAGGTAHTDGPGIDRWTPTLVAELAGRLRPASGWPAAWGLSFELRASWTLGGWPFQPVTYERRARTQQVLRNRFTFTLAAVHTFGHAFDVGLALGGGVASPLYYSRDRAYIRSAVGFFAGALFLRYRLTRRVDLELTAPRFFAPELVHSYHSDLFDGVPVRRERAAYSLALDFGVRIWL